MSFLCLEFDLSIWDKLDKDVRSWKSLNEYPKVLIFWNDFLLRFFNIYSFEGSQTSYIFEEL